MKWSELSDKDKVKLILQHVIPHDMGDDLVLIGGDILAPKGKRPINYPVAAWDWMLEYWQVSDIGSNGATIFDPLHNMNDAWLLVREMNKPQDGTYDRYAHFVEELEKIVGSNLFFDLFYCDDRECHLSCERICIASLKAVGVEIMP